MGMEKQLEASMELSNGALTVKERLDNGNNNNKASKALVKLWNSFAANKVKSAVEILAIERNYAELSLGERQLTKDQIVGAVENYRAALRLPNTQAYPFTLGQFLIWDKIRTYLPGNFNLANYDKSRFAGKSNGDGEFDAEEEVKRLKAKGMI